MSFSTRDVGIGDQEGGLNRVGSNFFSPYGDNYFGSINFDDPTDSYVVSFDGKSEAFDDLTFQSKSGSPNTLSCSGSICTYTLQDGTAVTFDKTLFSSGGIQANFATMTAITKPDGEVISFTYHSFVNTTVRPHTTTRYLLSVASSLGWMLKYHTSGDSPSSYPPVSVEAINTSVDYCDPTAMTCGTESVAWPAAQLSSTGATDPLGHKTTYTGGMAAPTSITSPLGANKTIAYYTSGTFSGSVHTVTVGSSTWTYAYSSSGTFPNILQTTTVTNPDGGVRTVVANLNTNQIMLDTDPLGRTISYAYYASTGSGGFNGAIYRIVASDATYSGASVTGGYAEYAYDARGNVTTETLVPKAGSGLSNLVTTYSYPSTCTNVKTCNQPTAVIDPAGIETDYTYDPNSGKIATVTKPAVGGVASQVRYTYTQQTPYIKNNVGVLVASTPVWRLTAVSKCMTGSAPSCVGTTDERKTTITYAGNNVLPGSVAVSLGDGTLARTTTFGFDVFGNMISADGPLPGSNDTSYFFYDALNRRTGEIDADPDGAGGLQRQAVRTTYNADGAVAKIESGAAAGTDATALAGMTVLDSYGSTFDSTSGLEVSYSHYAGTGTTPQAVTQTTYDSSLRISCVAVRMNAAIFGALPSSACTLGTQGTDGPDRIAKYTYDLDGAVTKITDGYGTAQQADTLTKTYNASAGTVSTVADANGNLTTLTYDGFDRLVKGCMPTASNGSISSTSDCRQLGYTASKVSSVTLRDSQVISLGYDATGRLSSRSGAGLSEALGYNNFGKVVSHTNNGLTETYAFNALDELLSDAQPAGTVSYAYDVYGRRSRITYPSYGGTPFYVDYSYRDDDTVLSENVSYNGTLATALNTSEDDYGRITGLTRGSTPVVGTSLAYDGNSRLQTLTNDLAGTSNDNTTTLSYSVNNLINGRSNSNGAFDDSVASAATTTFGPNGLNQLASVNSTGLSYDGRGNLSSDGSVTYTYNANNLLTATSAGASLTYDAENRLSAVAKAGATTQFLYDGTALIAEYDGSGTLLRRYVGGPGADQPLAWFEGTDVSQTRYLVTDERGTVINVTDSAGNSLATNRYDAFGVPNAGNLGRFQYTGQAYIGEVGLYNYKARMYSPTTARFMQPDPSLYGDGMNIYAYAHDNPVNEVDPTGLTTEDTTEVIVTADTAGGASFTAVEAALSPAVSRKGGGASSSDITVVIILKKRTQNRSKCVTDETGTYDICAATYAEAQKELQRFQRNWAKREGKAFIKSELDTLNPLSIFDWKTWVSKGGEHFAKKAVTTLKGKALEEAGGIAGLAGDAVLNAMLAYKDHDAGLEEALSTNLYSKGGFGANPNCDDH